MAKSFGYKLKALILVAGCAAVGLTVLCMLWSWHGSGRPAKRAEKKAASGRGAIRCDEPVAEFGKRYRPVDILEHTFKIRNNSSQKVRLKLTHVSCKCSKAEIAASELAAGQETEVKIRWDLTGLVGSKLFTAVIESTPWGAVTLSGKVNILDYFHIDRTSIAFGDVRPLEKRAERLIVQAPPGEVLSKNVSLAFQDLPGELTAEITERGAQTMTVETSVVGQAGKGMKEYLLVINTDSPIQPRIQIPVYANHLGEYEVQPSAVLFGGRSREAQLKWVTVVSHVDKKAVVERVIVDDPNFLSAELEMEEPEVKVRLERRQAEVEGGGRSGRVSIFLSGVEEPLLVRYGCL